MSFPTPNPPAITTAPVCVEVALTVLVVTNLGVDNRPVLPV
jgi:hypothetical protein